MDAVSSSSARAGRPRSPALCRILPLADRVEVLTRSTGRAFVAGDVELARALVAAGGEHQQLGTALEGAWNDVVCDSTRAPADVPVNVNLVHSLQTILALTGTICDHIVSLAAGEPRAGGPAIERLAEMVPDLLRDAVGALRRDDPSSAAEVLRSSIAVDACFAQTYLDLLQIARFETAQHLHEVTRALERIGDNAGEIAGRVQPAPA